MNNTSGEGSTPLLLATTLGRAEVLRVLLAWGAKPNVPSAAGAMPLHLASSFGHLECVAALLDAGADMTRRASAELACSCRLLTQLPFRRRTKDGHTALHLACWGGHENVTQLLLQRGAFLEAVTNAGYTALHEAARKGHGDCARILINAGASANALTRAGETPLALANARDWEMANILKAPPSGPRMPTPLLMG